MVAEAEPRLDNVRVASVEPQPSNNVAVEEVPGYEDLGLNTQVNVAHVAFATRPQLEVGAPEEEVARYEEMQSDSVRPQLLSETCLAMGLDSDSITCRLVARRFLLVNSCKLQKAVKHHSEQVVWLQRARPAFTHSSDPLFFRSGWDKKGHPLLVWDGPRIHDSKRSADELVSLVASVMQEAIDENDLGAHLHDKGEQPLWRLQKVTMILHLPKGSEPDSIRKIGKVMRTIQYNFPERLFKALIFPVSPWTATFWYMVKGFLSERVVQKIVFLEGGNKPEGLRDYVDPQFIPEGFLDKKPA